MFSSPYIHLLIQNSSKYSFLTLMLAHTQSKVPQKAWPKMHLWKRLEKSKERLYMKTGRWRRVCDVGHFALISTLGSTGFMCVCVCVNNTKPVLDPFCRALTLICVLNFSGSRLVLLLNPYFTLDIFLTVKKTVN